MAAASDGNIRVGLAGFGMSGQIFQAPFLSAADGFTLARIYERSRDEAKKLYPEAQTVRTFEELLTPDIDLIVIATPNALHVPMARESILAGKHVVVEKPVAATSKEAEELCQLARERGVLLTVFQNRRLDGDFLTLRLVMDNLGDIVLFESRFDRFVQGKSEKPWKNAGGPGNDLLYDIGIHLIDQAYALFGMPDEVYADLAKQRPDSAGTDCFTVLLYYPGLKVALEAGETEAIPGPRFLVSGTKGAFIKYGLDVQEGQVKSGMRPEDPQFGHDPEEMYGTLVTVDDGGVRDTQTVPTVAGSYGIFYSNLRDAMRGGEDLLVPPEEAVDVLRILEAARKSDLEKRRVQIMHRPRSEAQRH